MMLLNFAFVGVWLTTLSLAAFQLSDASQIKAVYVAPNGNDSWTGAQPTPNKQKTDGPFASVARARDAVRLLKQAAPGDTVKVILRGGTYYLTEPLALSPSDSGAPEAPVIYEAYDGEKPILSGGRPIKAFQDEQGFYQGSLSDVKDGKWDFSQLWVNGNRRFRPRVPKRGYSLIASDLPSSPESVGKGYDRFQFREGDIKSSWQNLADIDVVTFHSWTVSRLKIASLDDQSRAVKFTGRTVAEVGYFNLAQGNRYLIENVKEALSDPGEWYLDKPTGILSYIPDKGDQKKCEMIAPKLETLIKLQGDVDGRKWVQHVQFKGITFSHTNWVCPPGGYASPQAECYLGAAVSAEGARDCVFDGCTISHTGAYAIDLGAGCKRNTIQNCTLTDLGAGGVRIGLMAFSDDEKMASHNTVQNTTISHGGRLHPAGIGVWIGHSPHNIISHNDIYDLYYSGISCGWTWGYGQSQAHHNALEYNHIHDIGQAVLSDMGGIYTLGVAPGSVERGNVIHDVNSFAYGGWGIYFDEGSTGWLAEKNLVYRCKTGNFHQHYGKNNVVHNNIFALAPQSGQLIRTRPEEHISYFLDHNIIYYDDAPLLGSNWTTNNNFRLDYNLYWNAGIVPISFAGMTLEEWRKKGNDIHSVVADPLFVDIAKDDFRLKPASPALQMGFVEWDTSKAGRTSGSEKSQAVALPRAFPLPAPPPPNPVSQDFEQLDVGQKTTNAATHEENDKAVIRVTEETAASGKHSLKFTDVQGQKETWNPHIVFDPNFQQGEIRGSSDVRVEPGAIVRHEWRDAASPYHIGPNLIIAADGNLSANGKSIMALKHGMWYHIAIDCIIGKNAPGRYTLTIKPPDGNAIVQSIPCPDNLLELRWFGFISNANADTTFYLDNINIDQNPGKSKTD